MFVLKLSQEFKDRVNNNSENIINIFRPICQRYTDVMAHKYYLQEVLFNKTNELKEPMVITNLTSIIINLQVVANYLQEAQVCLYS